MDDEGYLLLEKIWKIVRKPKAEPETDLEAILSVTLRIIRQRGSERMKQGVSDESHFRVCSVQGDSCGLRQGFGNSKSTNCGHGRL